MGACHDKDREPAQPLAASGQGFHLAPPPRVVQQSSASASSVASTKSASTKSNFIFSNKAKIRDVYNLSQKIGEGTYGTVRPGTHKSTGIVRAVKSIAKRDVKNMEKLKQEILIMKRMDHPNIIGLFETFEDSIFIYLVMELCEGGELFDYIVQEKKFTEGDAAHVMQQVLRATFYMHDNNICHRDLKPENFLLVTKGQPISENTLKVIDFGLSVISEPGTFHKTKVGTPFYVAPQVLQGNYQRSCDVWSCGAIMYTILCGYPPFNGKNDEETLKKVRMGKFSFPDKDWSHVSADARDLIRSMMKLLPRDRCTAETALNHVWIKEQAPQKDRNLPEDLLENIKSFSRDNKLKKAALQVIAGQLDDGKIKGLRDAFTTMDVDGNGCLSVEELKDGLTEAGFRELPRDDSFRRLVHSVDADESGRIDYTEFLAASMDQRTYLTEAACRTAFEVFDLNGDGQITLSELKQVLNMSTIRANTVLHRSAESIMEEIDTNGDGTVDFDEFMVMMGVGLMPGSASSERKAALLAGVEGERDAVG